MLAPLSFGFLDCQLVSLSDLDRCLTLALGGLLSGETIRQVTFGDRHLQRHHPHHHGSQISCVLRVLGSGGRPSVCLGGGEHRLRLGSEGTVIPEGRSQELRFERKEGVPNLLAMSRQRFHGSVEPRRPVPELVLSRRGRRIAEQSESVQRVLDAYRRRPSLRRVVAV